MNLPDNLFYSKDHLWVRLENSEATIGITEYAQETLGDIVYVDLIAKGSHVNASNKIGEIESLKSTAEIQTPVSGDILDVNDNAIDKPEIINDDPYGLGWLVKIKIENKNELSGLLDFSQYREYIETL